MFTGLCGVHAGRLVIDSGKTVDRLQAECAHTCHGDALDGQIVRLGAAGSEDHVVRRAPRPAANEARAASSALAAVLPG